MKYSFIIKVLVTLTSVLAVHAQKKTKKPNFLFIVVDDQSAFDLKMYNPYSILETPTLDKLAHGGMIFEKARFMGAAVGAVCTPSRHQIMTGRTLWHLPPSARRHNYKEPHPLDKQTLAAIFNRAGYKTMRTCKQGNSYQRANMQFSVIKDKTSRLDNDQRGSAWHAKQVLEYLDVRERNNEKAPFLIYYGFSHPHDPRYGKPELLEKYGATNHEDSNSLPPSNPKQPEVPINYLAQHPFFHGHPNLRDEERVKGVWKNRDVNTIRNEQGREFACSENIDIQIEKVLKRLDDMGELDNTYIIYTADHGIAVGRHGLMGKQNLYEHTWQVPFFVNGPGIKAGSRVQGNIYLLDVLPTLCDLAGIKTPKTVEGKSFKRILEGKETSLREVMYGVYCGGTKPGMRTVTKGDWKLIKYDVMDGAVRETQLFNITENPYEFLPEHGKKNSMQTDLAENPKYAAKLKEMEELLLEQMIENDDPFRLWDQKK